MALIPGSGKNSEEKKAAQDDVLLREIDDAVREDQYREFAQKFGKPLLGLVIGGLLAFFITRGVTGPVNRIIVGRNEGAAQMTEAGAITR